MPHVGEVVLADGLNVGDPRFDRVGAQIIADAHGRYGEAVSRGRVFFACPQAAVTYGAGLSATVVTISVTNPLGSGRRLDLLDFLFAFSAAPAAAAVLVHAAFIPGVTTAVVHTTPLTVRAALLGGPSIGAVGLVDTAATLPAVPVIVRPVASIVAVGSITPPFIRDEIAGGLSLYPGSVIVSQALAAMAGFPVYVWEEVPL